MNAELQPLIIENGAILAKRFAGHDVRSQPEEGDEGGDAGELLPGRDLRFTEIVLDEQQFDGLIGEHAARLFFNSRANKPAERAFTTFDYIPLNTQFKNCTVTITFGISKDEVRIEPATIKNMRVKFNKTDRAELCCTVSGPRPRSLSVLDLESFVGKPVNIKLVFGALAEEGGQEQLPLTSSSQEGTPVERTRILEPGQAEREAETQRQLGEALRGLEREQQSQVEGGDAANEDEGSDDQGDEESSDEAA
jgi:hypothetical protein